MTDNSAANAKDFEDHKQTYKSFIAGAISLSLACFFILVCMVLNGFSDAGSAINLPVSLFFMFLGFVFLAVEVVKAGSNFLASTALLAVYALITIFMIT
jgi:ethanolamine transporter EutH